MARPSRLRLAQEDILALLSGAPQKVYSKTQLASILAQHRPIWHLSENTTASDFIAFLTKHGTLRVRKLRSEAYGHEITRYVWGTASLYELALSLKPHAYLSHGTAVTLHGLANLDRKTIYLNAEQSAKPSYGTQLTQHGINRAFAGKQRQSKLVYANAKINIVQLAGKNTNRLGVEDLRGPGSETLAATNLERTLIDIVVRPAYAGGHSLVLEAYRTAKSRMSIERLLAILKELNHAYPYHQAIGFLMQRASYSEKTYEPLRALGLEYDFHLTHGMKNPLYSAEWRLFYPKDLRG